MTRISAIAAVTALALFGAASAALVQNNTSAPRGTNSAGTAQSSGSPSNRDPGVTTGAAGRGSHGSGNLGSGNAAPPPTTSGDETINAENSCETNKSAQAPTPN